VAFVDVLASDVPALGFGVETQSLQLRVQGETLLGLVLGGDARVEGDPDHEWGIPLKPQMNPTDSLREVP
jgi:hypothetical protein